jgi:ribosomal protein S18 acetylase RimI-like enzyme
VTATIVGYGGTAAEDAAVASLLARVYVEGGFTAEAVAATVFAPSELKRRGRLLLATSPAGTILGMVVCGSALNPYRQVATHDEAEMQLLAVEPNARGQGLGRALCVGFEGTARSLGYLKAVLSTQPAMRSAHRLYESLGYRRNGLRDWVRADRSFFVYEKPLDAAGAAEP